MNSDTLARKIMRRRLERPIVDAERRLPSVAELRESEWCEEIDRLARNGMIMGAFRYGTISENSKSGKRHRNIESAIARLNEYLDGGNKEHLIDARNLLDIEFRRPGSHPNPHWSPIDDGVHKAVEL